VKYYLTKRPDPNAFGPTYEHVADFRDVHLFRNRYALPLGFCYDTYIPTSAFARLAPGLKDQAIVKAVVVDDKDVERLTTLQSLQPNSLIESYGIEQYDADTRARRQDTLSTRAHSQNRISGTITLTQKKLMFLSIPFDRGWSARVDGKKAELLRLNVGFMGLLLEPGNHTIDLEFDPPYLAAGAGFPYIAAHVCRTDISPHVAPRWRRRRHEKRDRRPRLQPGLGENRATNGRNERRCDYMISRMPRLSREAFSRSAAALVRSASSLHGRPAFASRDGHFAFRLSRRQMRDFTAKSSLCRARFQSGVTVRGRDIRCIVGNGILHHLYYHLDAASPTCPIAENLVEESCLRTKPLTIPTSSAIFATPYLRKLANLEPGRDGVFRSLTCRSFYMPPAITILSWSTKTSAARDP
jgi:hypothetical protein